MSGNEIVHLEPVFNSNTVLAELDLSKNQINQIDPKAFESLLALSTLNLSNNPFTHLPKFDGLLRLHDVRISLSHKTKILIWGYFR